MTHYDHATAMAFKLDKWSDERKLRNYELEALACKQRSSATSVEKLRARRKNRAILLRLANCKKRLIDHRLNVGMKQLKRLHLIKLRNFCKGEEVAS